MHEMSITQSIVELCQQHAGTRKVREVVIEIGELSSIVPEAVEFCFEACSQDTSLATATLKIDYIAGKGVCQQCNQETPLHELYAACTHCGSYQVTVIAGEELRVREIEVED